MQTFEPRHRFLLGALSLGHLCNDWVAGTLWLLAPAIAAAMGLGPIEVGLLLTVNGIGAGLAYIPAGVLSDRFARPGLLMLLSFWWVAIGYLAATLAPGFWAVTLLLAIGVMGDAFWHPVATGVLVKALPARRPWCSFSGTMPLPYLRALALVRRSLPCSCALAAASSPKRPMLVRTW